MSKPLPSLELSVGRVATLVCLLEVSAPKPGNVHRGADFEDATLEDFMASAVVLGQTLDEMADQPLGATIKSAVQQTQMITGTNTNLGMVLLLAPLAKAVLAKAALAKAARGKNALAKNALSLRLEASATLRECPLTQSSVQAVLDGLNSEDAENVFAAIRIANPSGLGDAEELDVNDPSDAAVDLIAAMRLAEGRDLVARQYANGFADVFELGVVQLATGKRLFGTLSKAIVFAHVGLMAEFPDSLIARKCGEDLAAHSQMLARKAIGQLESLNQPAESPSKDSDSAPLPGKQELENFWAAVAQLDFWLRSDGHRRNPGTTADLIAASLFVAVQNEVIRPPFR